MLRGQDAAHSANAEGRAKKPSAKAQNNASAQPEILASVVVRIFDKSLRIYSVAVSKSARGNGYGQLMISHAIDRAKALGKTTTSLEVDAANPQLIDWYTRCGFRTVQTLPDYYGEGLHGLRMRLPLSPATPVAHTAHAAPATRTAHAASAARTARAATAAPRATTAANGSKSSSPRKNSRPANARRSHAPAMVREP